MRTLAPALAGKSSVCEWSIPWVHDAKCISLSLEHEERECEALQMEESAVTYRDNLNFPHAVMPDTMQP
jgi:hypothetical protein